MICASVNDLLLNAKSVQGLHRTGATGTVPPASLRWRPSTPGGAIIAAKMVWSESVGRTELNCVSYR